MPNYTQLAAQEALELHELINSEVISAKKVSASMNMVKDTDLKNFMQDYLNARKTNIQQMQSIIQAEDKQN